MACEATSSAETPQLESSSTTTTRFTGESIDSLMISQHELGEFDGRIAARYRCPQHSNGWIRIATGVLKYSIGECAPYIQIYIVRST